VSTRAVFVDRDGTLVADTGFPRDPAGVTLYAGVGDAVRRLRIADWRIVVVTNQSGIARGLLTLAEYDAVERHIDDLLSREGAHLDATYVCPHYESVTGPCACRKPGTAHYLTAADRFGLELGQCVWIGDRATDLVPATRFGGLGVLVRTGHGREEAAHAVIAGQRVVDSFVEAANLVLTT
jgi:histidinol-phosphate phosphatase family protein